jgi:caffeoyl-CoA O-methyltransferase
VDQYANDLLGAEDSLLAEMRTRAEAEGLPRIQVPPEIGRLLTFLVTLTRAKRILEIGTLFGYSTLIMARALSEGGSLVTLEVEPRHAEIARRNLDAAGVSGRVRIVEGDALESLAGMSGETFDLVFIDADKATYPAYLAASLQLTHPGSVIVADNIWRSGSVAAPTDDNSLGAAKFNQAVAADRRLLTIVVPSRGGEDATSVSLVH